jgi:hypothetical protein
MLRAPRDEDPLEFGTAPTRRPSQQLGMVLNSAIGIKLPGDGNTTWFRCTRGKLDRVGCTAAKEASYFPLQSPTCHPGNQYTEHLDTSGMLVSGFSHQTPLRNGNTRAGVAVDPDVLGTGETVRMWCACPWRYRPAQQ